MPLVVVLVAFATLWAGSAVASGPAGKLICEREVQDVRAMFERKRQSIPQGQAKGIEDRLSLARTYCAAYNYPASVTMAGILDIRKELERR